MESQPLSDLPQKWRSVNDALKQKVVEYNEAVTSTASHEARLKAAMEEWELEKVQLLSTVNAVRADVADKRKELQAVEGETADLQRKVDERRRRNEEHLLVIEKRKNGAAQQRKAVESRDEAVRGRFQAFEASREETRQQIVAAIKKAEDSGPQEQLDYEQKVRALQSKIKEVQATIEAEAKSWALEQAMKEFNEKSDARKYLLEEVSAAEGGKDLWANLLQESNGHSVSDSLISLQELRSLVSA